MREHDANKEETNEQMKKRKDYDANRRRPSTKDRIDFGSIRSTDLKYSTDLNLPDSARGNAEITIQHQKHSTMKTIDDFIKKNRNTKGDVIKDANNHVRRKEGSQTVS